VSELAGSVGTVQRAPALTRADRDTEARVWLQALRGSGAEREDAAARLHGLLLRAARFELNRRSGMLAGVRRDTLEDLVMQSADDALAAILRKLDDYRFESRFTTWAYKFAILHAATHVRRLAWRGRELPVESADWDALAGTGSTEAIVERRELLDAVREAVRTVLTPHQRDVLVALAVNGVPIDVLAERLGTTRNALYKTLHDARRKLRTNLAERGLA